MSNNYFQFKQFRITQNRAAMRVNTDGVLLGAWVEVGGLGVGDNILDIGTGTGVIALMLAQRTESQVDAVEIDPVGAVEAQENVNASVWSGRVKVYNADIRQFTTVYKYKLIVSNPPYFVNSLAAPDEKRNAARHANELTYSDLIDCAERLLDTDGRFAVILPAEQERQLFCSIAAKKELYLHRITEVYSLTGSAPKRVLMEFKVKGSKFKDILIDTLTIEGGDGYTAEYKQLTRDFYLKF